MFNCQKAEDAIFYRKRKLLTNYASPDNLICYMFQHNANAETAAICVKSQWLTAIIVMHEFAWLFYIACSFVIWSIKHELFRYTDILLRMRAIFWCIFSYFFLTTIIWWTKVAYIAVAVPIPITISIIIHHILSSNCPAATTQATHTAYAYFLIPIHRKIYSAQWHNHQEFLSRGALLSPEVRRAEIRGWRPITG